MMMKKMAKIRGKNALIKNTSVALVYQNTELKNNNNFNNDFATTLLSKRLYYGGVSSKN